MLARLGEETTLALDEADAARLRAIVAPTAAERRHHEQLADGWMRLALAWQQAERVSGFLQWQALRWKDDAPLLQIVGERVQGQILKFPTRTEIPNGTKASERRPRPREEEG